MKRVIAVANQKGGVGKTTTAVNLAASFSAMRRRVLLIDIDPQGNATTGCGIDKRAIERGACEVLLGECSFEAAVLRLTPGAGSGAPSTASTAALTLTPTPTPTPTMPVMNDGPAPPQPLSLLPANQDLTSAEVRL